MGRKARFEMFFLNPWSILADCTASVLSCNIHSKVSSEDQRGSHAK